MRGGLRRKTGSGEGNASVGWLLGAHDAADLRERAGLSVGGGGGGGGFGGGFASAGSVFRLGVLNRRGPRRLFSEGLFVEATRALQNVATEEAYFEHKSPAEQAAWIHAHDLIISPHGAQLASLLFARPCTAVLELYPRYFYRPGFYLSLAVQVGALAFTGYPTPDAERDVEPVSRSIPGRFWHNQKHRYSQLTTDADTIVASVPEMLDAHRACLDARRNPWRTPSRRRPRAPPATRDPVV